VLAHFLCWAGAGSFLFWAGAGPFQKQKALVIFSRIFLSILVNIN
jgi:hypothetical protein